MLWAIRPLYIFNSISAEIDYSDVHERQIKVKLQVYSLMTCHPTLHFTPWSLDLFIRVPFHTLSIH